MFNPYILLNAITCLTQTRLKQGRVSGGRARSGAWCTLYEHQLTYICTIFAGSWCHISIYIYLALTVLPFWSAATYFVLLSTIATFTGQHVMRRIFAVPGRTSIIISLLALTVFVSAISLGISPASLIQFESCNSNWSCSVSIFRSRAQTYQFPNPMLKVEWASKTWPRSWRIKNTWDLKIYVTNPTGGSLSCRHDCSDSTL